MGTGKGDEGEYLLSLSMLISLSNKSEFELTFGGDVGAFHFPDEET